MIRSIIVDDEKRSISTIADMLQTYTSNIEIVAEATSVVLAVSCIDTYKPDLIFLDIELGDGSGFDVLAQTVWKDYKIIFTTAYSEYASQAFRVNAVDYLLKPINSDYLKQAVKRVLEKDINTLNRQIRSLMQELKGENHKISIATVEGKTLVAIRDIIHCESDNNYCKIFLTQNEELYVSKTLKDLESLFAPYGFERVHQSHLINIEHIKKYLNRAGGTLLLSSGAVVPIAQRKRTYILKLLDQYI